MLCLSARWVPLPRLLISKVCQVDVIKIVLKGQEKKVYEKQFSLWTVTGVRQ